MIYNYIWYFFIYSFLGWCLEVIYASLEREDFVNRGFLNGSYCPIYGFGAVCEIFLLTKFVNYPICLYIISVVITTVLEFITGYVLEKIFNLQWWDYTNEKFNIKGYICLKFSLLWGVASLVLMYILQPKVNIVVSLLRHIDFVVYLLILLMLYDFLISILKVLALKKDSMIIEKLNEDLKILSNEMAENISYKTHRIEKKINKKYRRLLKSYPKLKRIISSINKK